MKKFLALSLTTIAILSACNQNSAVTKKEGDAEKIQDYNNITAESDADHATYGKQVDMLYGAVTGAESNGVAFIRTYEDGTTSVQVNLNVAEAPEDEVYQVIVTDGANEAFMVGTLTSVIGDARHSVKADTKDDLTGLTTVKVVQVKGTASEGSVIAEGTVKRVTR